MDRVRAVLYCRSTCKMKGSLRESLPVFLVVFSATDTAAFQTVARFNPPPGHRLSSHDVPRGGRHYDVHQTIAKKRDGSLSVSSRLSVLPEGLSDPNTYSLFKAIASGTVVAGTSGGASINAAHSVVPDPELLENNIEDLHPLDVWLSSSAKETEINEKKATPSISLASAILASPIRNDIPEIKDGVAIAEIDNNNKGVDTTTKDASSISENIGSSNGSNLAAANCEIGISPPPQNEVTAVASTKNGAKISNSVEAHVIGGLKGVDTNSPEVDIASASNPAVESCAKEEVAPQLGEEGMYESSSGERSEYIPDIVSTAAAHSHNYNREVSSHSTNETDTGDLLSPVTSEVFEQHTSENGLSIAPPALINMETANVDGQSRRISSQEEHDSTPRGVTGQAADCGLGDTALSLFFQGLAKKTPTKRSAPSATTKHGKESLHLEISRTDYDTLQAKSSNRKQGHYARADDNPAKKRLARKIQDNIHLISTLQDAPVKLEENDKSMIHPPSAEVDKDVKKYVDVSKRASTFLSTSPGALDDEEADSFVSSEIVPDPADTQQQWSYEAEETSAGNLFPGKSATPVGCSRAGESARECNQAHLISKTPDSVESLTAIERREAHYPLEDTNTFVEESNGSRLFPANASGDELTEHIRQHIQREAARTTRELWRRNNRREALVGSNRGYALEIEPGPIRTGRSVLFSSREDAAEPERQGRKQISASLLSFLDAASDSSETAAKHLPRKSKSTEQSSLTSELLVKLPKQPKQQWDGRFAASSSRIFRRPKEAAQQAETSRVAMSLGRSRLVKVTKNTANGSPLARSRSSKKTRVMFTAMFTVLLATVAHRLLLSLVWIRRLLY